MSKLGLLVAGISPQISGFAPRTQYVEFAGQEVVLGHSFSRYFDFLLAFIILPMTHIHSLLSGEWVFSPFEGTISDRRISYLVRIKL